MEHPAVGAREAHGGVAGSLDGSDDLFVDEPGEDGNDYAERFLVGHAEAALEARGNVMTRQPLTDQEATAVNHHGPEAPTMKLDYIFDRRIAGAQDGAANLDDNNLTGLR